ncbi:MAG TPA: NAD(P)H-dependent oxidoreductase [Planctomycetota bacterium]|nr:NAD(P)H-dependent oxidoreductase [Planctomycetota bacterium]
MSHPNPVPNETVIRQLHWRYATKKFDPTKRISDADWKTLEEALVLTPSSFGAQPWKFFVVDNPALKEKLVAASWGQRQVQDASHTTVFAIKRNMDVPFIERYIQRTAEVRGVAPGSLDKFKQVLVNFASKPGFDIDGWATNQVYIALGNFMTTAAMLGIDTCPMEGLVPAKYDEILGLDKLGYATIVACPAGYRAADDKYAVTPKVRFRHEDVVAHI